MKKLMDELVQRFDFIVIDTPPVLVGADVQLISRFADTIIMVVRWGRTPQKAVNHAIKILKSTGIEIAGTVLSVVDVKRYASYDYGDSGRYSGKLARYYARD